jgi:polyferredoxin
MWKTRRRAVALLGGAATLLLPFLTVRGRSAFRFDIPTLSLHFFGAVLPIDEFFLVLLASLFLVALVVGVSSVFGRLWCGWLCPQTVIGELADWIVSPLPRRFRKAGRAAVSLPFTAVVSLSLLWYFVPPVEATRNLLRSPVLLGFFLAQWGGIFAMTAVVGTRFCKTVCPYAMLQNVLADQETMSVAYDPSRGGCLDCNRCLRACPVGIDIRKGPQRECIACADCIDACREATARVGVAPFVAYRGSILRGKTYLFAGAVAAAALVLLTAYGIRPEVRFTVQWEGQGPVPATHVYRYAVRNDSDRPLSLLLSVDPPARILGDGNLVVPPQSGTTGRITVQGGDPARGAVVVTATARGRRYARKAAFP